MLAALNGVGMDTWVILAGIGIIVLFSIYHSGAKAEQALNYEWVAQFKDRSSNDVIVRIFSSKEMYEGARELKKGDFKEAFHYFNSVGESAKGTIFSKREQEFFRHPAISEPVAPLSFQPDQGRLPPNAVINWLDLMAWFADQELVTVRYFSDGAISSPTQKHKLMIECPSCQRKMNIPAGKTIQVTCPHCQVKFKATT